MPTRFARRHGVRTLLCIGAVAFTVVACSSGGGSKTTSPSGEAGGLPSGDIKVGVIIPLSGQLAGLGQGLKNAISAFVDELNTSGGIKGHHVTLVTENDANDPATGVAVAQKLKSEGVAVSFAVGLGPVPDQVIPVLMKEKILVITNYASDEDASDVAKYPYYFSSEGTYIPLMTTMADYAKSVGVKTFGTINDGLPISVGFTQAFQSAAKAAGLDDRLDVSYSPTAIDLSTQVSKLKSANVDAIAATTETQFAAIYKAVQQLNWNPLILGDTITPLTDATSATANTVYPCFGALANNGTAPQGTVAAIASIKQAGAQGTVIPQLATLYRDEVQLFAKAVDQADSLDPDKLKAALETFVKVSPTAPEYAYTYSGRSHNGWAGPTSVCHLSPVSPEGLPYKAS